MFEFRFIKKVLSPLFTKAIATSIDEAVQTKSITDSIEKLLSVKEEAKDNFDKAATRAAKNGSLWLAFGSIGLLVAGTMAAVVGSLPLIVAALAFYFGGGAMCQRALNHVAAIKKSRDMVEDKIGSEVLKLSDSSPEEAVKSPRFLKALKARFNLASASEADVKQLKALFAAAPVRAVPAATAKPVL
jgi:hypothetical protein